MSTLPHLVAFARPITVSTFTTSRGCWASRKSFSCHGRPLSLDIINNHVRKSAYACAALSLSGSTNSKRVVCVGDIHGQWDSGDEQALAALRPDLVLFVGDYGDEDIKVTGRISALSQKSAVSNFGVATVFGNHDAFYTAHNYGRSRAPSCGSRVQLQQAHLRDTDVSYTSRRYARNMGDVSVVGGRSFSWGGPHWKHRSFYNRHVGISGMRESSKAICNAVNSIPLDDDIIFLAHVGPTGLGDGMSDPCGRDWGDIPGGDWGDADLREAINYAREQRRSIPLVVFGHMHRALYGGGARTMVVTEQDNESGSSTVMLNAAVVPRHRLWNGAGFIRNFSLVVMDDEAIHGDGNGRAVNSVDEIWMTSHGNIIHENRLYERERGVLINPGGPSDLELQSYV